MNKRTNNTFTIYSKARIPALFTWLAIDCLALVHLAWSLL